MQWSAGHYSWRTNRSAFFHDLDNPAFKDVRDAMTAAETQLASLRAELESPNTTTARRYQVREQLKRLTAGVNDTARRLVSAADQATLEKTRHEAAHQILFNAGLQRRGQFYPFWLAEGLATLFEAGPRNTSRNYTRQLKDASAAARLMPMFDFLGYTPGAADKPDDVLDHYAQAWSFIHFLWNHRQPELSRYLSGIDTPDARRNLNAHFSRCFGDLADLDLAYQRHVKALLADDPPSTAVAPAN